MSSEVESRGVLVHIRPRRRALLVSPAAPIRSLRWLFESMSSVWGGYYTLLVPTNGDHVDDVWLSHLRRFDPDIVVSALSESSLSKRASRQVEARCGPFRSHDGELIQPEALAFSYPDTPLKTILSAVSGAWVADIHVGELPAEAQVFFMSRFGAVGAALRSDLSARAEQIAAPTAEDLLAFPVKTFSFDHSRESLEALFAMYMPAYPTLLPHEWPVTPSQPGEVSHERVDLATILSHSPLNLCRLAIEDVSLGKGFPLYATADAPTVCAVGKTLGDYALAHNFERFGRPSFWLPVDAPVGPGADDPATRFPLLAAKRFVSEIRREREPVAIVSTSLGPDVLAEIARWLADLGVEGLFFLASEGSDAEGTPESRKNELRTRLQSQLLVKNPGEVGISPFTASVTGTRRSDALTFVSKIGTSILNVPVPPFRAASTRRLSWVADIAVRGYRLPIRSELSPKPAEAEKLGLPDLGQEVRVSALGLAFVATRHFRRDGWSLEEIQVRPMVNLLAPIDTFRTILDAHGLTLRSSDKGDFFRLIESRHGSLADLSKAVTDPSLLQLTEALSQGPGSRGSFEGIRVAGRWHLTASSAFIHIQSMNRDAGGLLKGLLEARWIEPGFILKCQFCRAAEWYPPRDVDASFRCRRCNEVQIASPLADPRAQEVGGPRLYYRLNELARLFLVNGGDLTAMALAALEEYVDEPITYIPEFHLFRSGDAEPWMELDFAASVGGLLAFGESRKTWRLTGRDRDRMKAKMKKINAFCQMVNPDMFVIASGTPLPETDFLQGLRAFLRDEGIWGLAIIPDGRADRLNVVDGW